MPASWKGMPERLPRKCSGSKRNEYLHHRNFPVIEHFQAGRPFIFSWLEWKNIGLSAIFV
jgi:hypothetical protein